MENKRFLLQFKKKQRIFDKNIPTRTLLSVVRSPMWFLERFSAISVSFSSIAFFSLLGWDIYRENKIEVGIVFFFFFAMQIQILIILPLRSNYNTHANGHGQYLS